MVKKMQIIDFGTGKASEGRDEWNKDRINHLDYIHNRLCEKSEVRAYINNVTKRIKLLPPEPQLSDFYSLSERTKKH